MIQLRRDAYAVVDERSGGQCEAPAWMSEHFGVRCPERAIEHHHRRPRRSGGSTDPVTETAANVVHACAGHHRFVESERGLAIEKGWLVHAGQDPASVPVLTWQGLVLLREDGSVEPVTEESA